MVSAVTGISAHAHAEADGPRRQPAVENGAAGAVANGARASSDWAVIADGSAGRMAQRAAANRLIMSADPATQARVAEMIAATPVGTGAGNGSTAETASVMLILEQIGAQAVAPTHLTASLAKLVTRGDRVGLLAAEGLGSIRTPAAARALIEAMNAESASRELVVACSRALRRMTGRLDLGQDSKGWAKWLAGVEFLPEAEWRRVLLEGVAGRADELAASRAMVLSRLVEARRREFLELPQGGPRRWELLAGLLVDDVPEVRQLAIELLKRELANGRVPDPIVVDSVADLLADGAAEIRAAAAELLSALAPPNAGALVADALVREREAMTAGALLQAAARWPSEQLRAPAMQWLKQGMPARRGAIEALAAMRRAELLPESPDTRAIAEVLGTMRPEDLSDAGVWLLMQLGEPEQRRVVAGWLAAPALDLRMRAAAALSSVQEGVVPLVEAARRDAALFDPAARALLEFQVTPEGFARLASLQAPTLEARVAALTRLADKIPLAPLMPVLRAVEPAGAREEVLTRRLGSAPSSDPVVHAGLVLLAQTRLALGRPARAIEALDLIVVPEGETPPADGVAARCTALVWLDKLEAAEKLNAPASAWLDGLEQAIRLPHARAIVRAIEAFGPERLDEAGRERLRALAARLPPESAEAEPEEEPAPAAPGN